jgi:hypothetical protein
MDVVCQATMLNDGCDYRRADPNSSVHWVRVDIDLKNITNEIIDVERICDWAVAVGGRFYGFNDAPTGVDSIDDVLFVPGSTVRTSVYARVPKSAGTANLLLLLRLTGLDWTYFGT